MATSLEALDTHMLAGILVDYEENLDHNRLAAQIDDIVELQNRLIPELKVTDDGIHRQRALRGTLSSRILSERSFPGRWLSELWRSKPMLKNSSTDWRGFEHAPKR